VAFLETSALHGDNCTKAVQIILQEIHEINGFKGGGKLPVSTTGTNSNSGSGSLPSPTGGGSFGKGFSLDVDKPKEKDPPPTKTCCG